MFIQDQDGLSVLIDQIKNGLFYGGWLLLAEFLFTVSNGLDIWHILGWGLVMWNAVVTILSLPNTLISSVTIVPSIPLYFSRDIDAIDKFLFDVACLAGLFVNLMILIGGYQIISYYGDVGLPVFEPEGIRLFPSNII
jgi:Na+/H+ antiporter NhaB